MNAPNSAIVSARRARLREWIATHFNDSKADFVRATGINQGELSGLLRNKSFGEARAANLESQAKMPAGYLVNPLSDQSSQNQSQPERLDPEKLASAIAFVRQLESNYQRAFTLESVSLVAAAVYEYLLITEKPNAVTMALRFGKMLEDEDGRLRKIAGVG